MDEKLIDSVFRIILIIALVCCVVSMLLPWGDITVEGVFKAEFYCWGASSQSMGIFTGSSQETWLYVSLFFNEHFMNLITENGDLFGFVFPMIFGILVFPFMILGLGFGSFFLVKKQGDRFKNIRDAGIFVIAALIFYYIFIQFGFLSLLDYFTRGISSVVSISRFFSYASGFYLGIVAVVLIFGLFIVHNEVVTKVLESSDVGKSDDDVVKLLKTRYVKGEISKDEYEQMRKDIE